MCTANVFASRLGKLYVLSNATMFVLISCCAVLIAAWYAFMLSAIRVMNAGLITGFLLPPGLTVYHLETKYMMILSRLI